MTCIILFFKVLKIIIRSKKIFEIPGLKTAAYLEKQTTKFHMQRETLTPTPTTQIQNSYLTPHLSAIAKRESSQNRDRNECKFALSKPGFPVFYFSCASESPSIFVKTWSSGHFRIDRRESRQSSLISISFPSSRNSIFDQRVDRRVYQTKLPQVA